MRIDIKRSPEVAVDYAYRRASRKVDVPAAYHGQLQTMFSTLATPIAVEPAAAQPPLLRAQNVHRILGSGDAAAHILKGVDVTIARGEYVSIVGASGSGKSTL